MHNLEDGEVEWWCNYVVDSWEITRSIYYRGCRWPDHLSSWLDFSYDRENIPAASIVNPSVVEVSFSSGFCTDQCWYVLYTWMTGFCMINSSFSLIQWYLILVVVKKSKKSQFSRTTRTTLGTAQGAMVIGDLVYLFCFCSKRLKEEECVEWAQEVHPAPA
jgi:hypothetical protein